MNQPPLPQFRYLGDLDQSWYKKSRHICVCCNTWSAGFWFIRRFDSGYDEYHVCPECLSAGRLRLLGLKVNVGNPVRLSEELGREHPELSDCELAELVESRTDEIEYRTPMPRACRLSRWPDHCGDYAQFCGLVGADDIRRICQNGNGAQFLKQRLHPDHDNIDPDYLDRAWRAKLAGAMHFYLWTCVDCRESVITHSRPLIGEPYFAV